MPNLYDDETFFAAYAAMPRSRGGLAAAGEWHQLRPVAVMAGIAAMPPSRAPPRCWGWMQAAG